MIFKKLPPVQYLVRFYHHFFFEHGNYRCAFRYHFTVTVCAIWITRYISQTLIKLWRLVMHILPIKNSTLKHMPQEYQKVMHLCVFCSTRKLIAGQEFEKYLGNEKTDCTCMCMQILLHHTTAKTTTTPQKMLP